MSHMTGKVALVTGASSGIGKATAEAFAAKGANVVVAARRKEELDNLVASIEAKGGKASAVKTDGFKLRVCCKRVCQPASGSGKI